MAENLSSISDMSITNEPDCNLAELSNIFLTLATEGKQAQSLSATSVTHPSASLPWERGQGWSVQQQAQQKYTNKIYCTLL